MKTQEKTIAPILHLFTMQSKLFENILKDIKEEDLHRRPNDMTNHIAWIAGHILSTRYMIGNMLGLNDQEPNPELFANGKSIMTGATYPPSNELMTSWNLISTKIIDRLSILTDEELSEDPPFPVPVDDHTVRGLLTFFAHHEAYHLGQMGMVGKYLGYDAWSFN